MSKNRSFCAIIFTFFIASSVSSTAEDLKFIAEGPDSTVTITFDTNDIPTINAKRYIDVLFGQGFTHARHRFFQMDLMRRQAAGELSGLIGEFSISRDIKKAVHRRRALATTIFENLPDAEQEMLTAYSSGVNEGLVSLSEPIIEYETLGIQPSPWTPEDCVLTLLTMFDMLERQNGNERGVEALRSLVPKEYSDWLMTQISPYEALVIHPDVAEVPPSPPAAVRKSSRTPSAVIPTLRVDTPEVVLGSNNFAVAGSRTADGRAILANDPHLMISAPSIWYRCRFIWIDHDMVGLSLPGAPGIVVGTNGHIAWGVTNTTGDFKDTILVEINPEDPMRYRVGNTWEPFDIQNVPVKIRGQEDQIVESRWTRWGPIVAEGPNGEPIAELSVGWQPGAVNFGLHAMADAKTVDDAIAVARMWNGPSQNVLVADADGRIGWIVSGWIPKRVGFDGRVPTSLADGVSGWDGPIDEKDRPVKIDPESGYLFTANSRTVPLTASRLIGNGFAHPARSHRIQQRLHALEVVTEKDLLDLQLDEYAQDLELYRPLYLEGLRLLPESPRRNTLIDIISKWNGEADADNLALAPLIEFQAELRASVRASLIAGYESTEQPNTQLAASAITINAVEIALKERPPHLIRKGRDGWALLLKNAAASTINQDAPLEKWGEVNRSTFKHPIAMASPMIGTGFDLPSTPQSGYRGAVRVSGPTFGASARIVVSPNHLDDAILQTPGGQSGDPYSNFYSDLHQAWLDGEPSPLLPREIQRSVTISPRDN